jgi:hypothetical protein
MGSQHPVRQRVTLESWLIGPNAVAGHFDEYMRGITPTYARGSQGRRAATRPQEREKMFRAQDHEAMYFFSESHMR